MTTAPNTIEWQGKVWYMTPKGKQAYTMAVEIAAKYGFNDEAYWPIVRSTNGKDLCMGFALTHDACEMIAEKEHVIHNEVEIVELQGPNERVVVKVTSLCGDKHEITFGEADRSNTSKNAYLVAMAEKRGKDRATLKLTGIYAHGIYSDIEAEDFRRENSGFTPKSEKPTPTAAPKPVETNPDMDIAALLETTASYKGQQVKFKDLPESFLQWCVKEKKGRYKECERVLAWRAEEVLGGEE